MKLKESDKLGIFTYRDAIRMIAEGKGFDDKIDGRFNIEIFNLEDEIGKAIPWIIEKNNRHVVIKGSTDVYLLSVKDILGKSIWVQHLLTS